ncbi:MAG: helix-turn-helix transcriptional regulator [Phycisphaeraceae bacterium]|nr:helix-turn-helix transcriptional regulator [Phycisphaeraceae bacterium]
MSDILSRIQRKLAEYQATPEGFGNSLRHDVAMLIVDRLEELGWHQRDLARVLGKPDSFISRLIHSDSNCTVETIGEVCHALGIKPLITARESRPTTALHAETRVPVIEATGDSHGEEEIVESESSHAFVSIAHT